MDRANAPGVFFLCMLNIIVEIDNLSVQYFTIDLI